MSTSRPDRGWPLEGGYRVELFSAQDAVGAEDVVAMWTGEAGLEEEEARRRLSELHLVAISSGGELAGMGTTYLQRNQQLRAQLWHYRAFVPAAHRRSALALWLARIGRDQLEEGFASGQDRRGIGVLYEVENAGLKRLGQGALARFNAKAFWPGVGFTFVGENQRGDHVRVYYFPGALAPEPDA